MWRAAFSFFSLKWMLYFLSNHISKLCLLSNKTWKLYANNSKLAYDNDHLFFFVPYFFSKLVARVIPTYNNIYLLLIHNTFLLSLIMVYQTETDRQHGKLWGHLCVPNFLTILVKTLRSSIREKQIEEEEGKS